MIELRACGTESWLEPRWARRLSAKLGDKLWERCEGRRGLFVTLTYDRSEYKNAQDLYRRQSEEQHVPLFLRKVARQLGVSLKGKWFCKLEFQKAGWVHWHIVILDVDKIPHKLATELWGHGHVWLRRLNRRNVRYCTKYTVKAGEVPAWLYLERPRSVKIVRVSPGFWGEAEREEREEPGEKEPDPYDVYGPAAASKVEGMYVPLGEKMERDVDGWVARDSEGRYRRGRTDLAYLLVALLQAGHGVVGSRGSWLVVDASLDQLEAAAARAAAEPAERARRRSLHLIGTGDRDAGRIPRWLDDWMREWVRGEEGAWA